MLRSVLLGLLFIIIGKPLFSQDTIYKVNHDKVIAKVLEVGPSEIKYKRYSAPDGPLYIVKRVEIWKIVYADGTVEQFNTSAATTKPAVVIPSRRWTGGFNAFDLMFGVITLSAEYQFRENLALRIPFSTGVGRLTGGAASYNEFLYYNKNKLFSVGLDGLLYPRGRSGIVNYYTGIALEFGKTDQYSWWGPYYSTETYVATGVVNGIMIKASDRIHISIDAKLGMTVMDYNAPDYWPMGRIGITMAWNFGNTLPAQLPVRQKS